MIISVRTAPSRLPGEEAGVPRFPDTGRNRNGDRINGYAGDLLTGVNIGDFGKPNGETFHELIHELDKVEGIDRIRISSIEPELLNEEMIAFIARSEKFLPHFHIPLQSGSDKVLKAMKRKYKRDVFAQRVSEIKKHMPHACIAADVIIGFPGETEKEFKDTYDFIDGLDISYMHVFTYSARPGTKAASLDGKVSNETKRERSKVLHELSDEKKKNSTNKISADKECAL